MPLNASNWFPIGHDLRITGPVNSISYEEKIFQNPTLEERLIDNEIHEVNKLKKHLIHKAIEWKRMLDDQSVRSYSEIASEENFTRTSVTQIMNMLKLLPPKQPFESSRNMKRIGLKIQGMLYV